MQGSLERLRSPVHGLLEYFQVGVLEISPSFKGQTPYRRGLREQGVLLKCDADGAGRAQALVVSVMVDEII
jgi:hypothetical protein